jgi:hypothetical protein
MHSSNLRYHDLTVVVEPMNIIWMWMYYRSQAKLLDYLTVHQVVTATAIDDGENTTIIDDEEDVKQVVALNLFHVINLCAQRSLHNDSSVMFQHEHQGSTPHLSHYCCRLL